MKRRDFILGSAMVPAGLMFRRSQLLRGYKVDVAIVGGGLGGVAAALSALKNGKSVLLSEETDWVGGQMSQQGVPPDEHKWIETHGATKLYRSFRNLIREYYLANYPLTAASRARQHLNPGNGAVSRLCCEPTVAWSVLRNMLSPYLSNGSLILLTRHSIGEAHVADDRISAITLTDGLLGLTRVVEAKYFIDATELGDLLPLSNTEYVTGAEARAETHELHALEEADPSNNQSFTMCFAMDYRPNENHVIDRPESYEYWRAYVPPLDPAWSGPLLDLKYSNPQTLQPKQLGFDPTGRPTGDMLNLWNYRKIIDRNNFTAGTYAGDITIVNWPQNDYMVGNIVDVSTEEKEKHIARSKELSLCLFYWLQTEAPRPDGGMGWSGLRLRGDVLGTTDGLAQFPYVRESRRIKSLFLIKEEHVGKENRKLVSGKDTAAEFYDTVGVGYYHIDLHPSSGGNNYIDFPSLPFQIPLGALIPIRMKNILPACKNIGTTHITNGCYRLHPVEWSIGEVVGELACECIDKQLDPIDIRESISLLDNFQKKLVKRGVELQWPSE